MLECKRVAKLLRGGALLAAALLVPEAGLRAAALVFLAPVTISGTTGLKTLQYTVHVPTGFPDIIAFELPEYAAGDLQFTTLPAGWVAVETTTAAISGAGLYGNGTVAAYVELIDTGGPADAITGAQPLSFTATVPRTTTTNAAFAFLQDLGNGTTGITILDPPIPAPIPEPATLALVAAGLTAIALRRVRFG